MLRSALVLAFLAACSTQPLPSVGPGAGGALQRADAVSGTHSSGGSRWTVLVYMAADNNLEPFALLDLQEMMQVGAQAGLDILVEIDRAAGYSDDPVGGIANFETAKRLRVQAGSLEELMDLGEIDTAQPQTLSDFVSWGVQASPADRYALFLWNHGAGWVGFGADDTGASPMLSLTDMDRALGDARHELGLDPFALIGFDACLMANLETATALQPHAELLLASEELEPDEGWDYKALAVLRDNPGADAVAAGKAIMRAFVGSYPGGATLSLTDLFHVPDLLAAVDHMGQTLAAVDQRLLARGIGKVQSQSPLFTMDGVDLGAFATRLGNLDPDFGDAAAPVNDAVAHAVLARMSTVDESATTGLTVYLPLGPLSPDYAALPYTRAWAGFLGRFEQAAATLTAPALVSHVLSADATSVHAALASGTAGDVTDVRVFSGAGGMFFSRAGSVGDDDVARAPRDQSVVMLQNGAVSTPAAADLDQVARGRVWLRARYRADASAAPVFAMISVLMKNGQAASLAVYSFGAQGFGRIAPGPNATLEPDVLRFQADALSPASVPAGTAVPAGDGLTVVTAPFPSGAQRQDYLVVTSAWNRGDWAETQ